LWEIDVLRGVAVVAMVLYHFSYDLAYFGLFEVRFFRFGPGLDLGRAIGTSFIFLAGFALTLSYRKAIANRQSGGKLFTKYLRRGVTIFTYGLAITFVTWIFVPREMIVFGVLHLIGASIVLAYPLLSLRLPNLALGIACIIAGLYVRDFDNSWLVWLGTAPSSPMLDYWPIIPWFGVILLGIFFGNVFHGERGKQFIQAAPPSSQPLAFLGRHSLAVYLIHQPILLAVLVLLGVGNTEAVL
jgi:uncharacterized membrane protein